MFTQLLRKKRTELFLKTIKQFSIFIALFIALGHIVAQAQKMQSF